MRQRMEWAMEWWTEREEEGGRRKEEEREEDGQRRKRKKEKEKSVEPTMVGQIRFALCHHSRG